MKKIPEDWDNAFLRFSELPKKIVYELAMKDLSFYMEKDQRRKFKGKPTYKIAAEKFGTFKYI